MYNHQPLCPFNVFSIPVIAKTLASQIAPIPITLSCFVHGWRIKIIPGKTYENVAQAVDPTRLTINQTEGTKIEMQKARDTREKLVR